MPTYVYKCSSCEHEFEVRQGINEEKLVDCSECKQPDLQRLISGAPRTLFIGEGWSVNTSKNCPRYHLKGSK